MQLVGPLHRMAMASTCLMFRTSLSSLLHIWSDYELNIARYAHLAPIKILRLPFVGVSSKVLTVHGSIIQAIKH